MKQGSRGLHAFVITKPLLSRHGEEDRATSLLPWASQSCGDSSHLGDQGGAWSSTASQKLWCMAGFGQCTYMNIPRGSTLMHIYKAPI